MKTGSTLQELAAEILRQKEAKQDYLIDTSALRMESFDGDLFLRVLDSSAGDRIEPLDIGDNAHMQIGTHLSIPAKYYSKMREEYPELLSHNVNRWFERAPAQRMVRTLYVRARAFLSNRYRRLDHYELTEAVLPIIGDMPNARIESCQITEDRLYIKVINPRLQMEVTPGDIVQSGLIISNSEVGLGSVNIQPLIYRLVCSNGMVVNDAAAKRHHVGRVAATEDSFLLYSSETLEADDRAFMMKVQDTVRAVVEEAQFARVVDRMREATAVPMNTTDIPELVRLASREFKITDEERPGILQHLIEGKDLTLYGLANAVTRYSQDVDSYDRATDLESIGYNILTMPKRQWDYINQMAA